VVLPVNYVVVGQEIVIRTRGGSVLASATKNTVVAFEVDDTGSDSCMGWSVMVQGRTRPTAATIAAGLVTEPALARWHRNHKGEHCSILIEVISGRRILRPAALSG
jgi:nitroimidazol reductase NimA-like FMN-containing flavoprotein (pyridoxamine 5'-phosphate oxidase superfamily)